MPEHPTTSLAVVLATDHYETIRPVVRHLRKQTIRGQLEIIIVGARGVSLGVARSELGEFGRVEVVEVESLLPIGPARAAGVRSCRSPLVFIGETHTYAHPTWAETLIRAHGSNAGIVPGFGNANPKTALSWAIFLLDYGQFFHLVPARESDVAPSHNGAFTREACIEAEHVALPVSAPGPSFARQPSGVPLFVYCGRLHPTKGVPLLLQAFARLRRTVSSAQLRIVGDGPQRDLLQHQVHQLGLQKAVTFRGWVPPDDVEHELADAWAVVVPSLWAEPLGLVALEAVVRGIPVVASAAGGLGETIEHGTSGLLFTNGNEDELYGLLADVAARTAFPTHALPDAVVRDALDRHDPKRHIALLRGIFRELALPRDSDLATGNSPPVLPM